MLHRRHKRLGLVHRAELEVGQGALEEVSSVVGDTETVRAAHAHKHVVGDLAGDDALDLVVQRIPVPHRRVFGVEEGLAASYGRECGNRREVHRTVGEDEGVDSDTDLRQLVRSHAPEGIRRRVQLLLLVGAGKGRLVAWRQPAWADLGKPRQEEVDLATQRAKAVHRSLDRGADSTGWTIWLLLVHGGDHVQELFDLRSAR